MFRKEVIMNIKEILAEIVPKAELSDENRKALTDWLEQTGNVHEHEDLLKTIEQLQNERDCAQKSLNDMIFKNHITELAENYSFSDKSYLEYLCKVNNIDLADNDCIRKFMLKLQSETPKFFKIKLQSGTGNPPPANNCSHSPKDYQSDDILTLLNNAPEVRG